MNKLIKIIAVDDSHDFLDSLKNIFAFHKDKYKLIACISTMEDKDNEDFLIEKIGRVKPDIILMDFSFALIGRPSDLGIDLVKRIRKKYPTQKIIMLTSDRMIKGSEQWNKVRRSFAAGAMGYLGKDQIDSWTIGIDEIVKGEVYLTKKTINRMLKGFKMSVNNKTKITPRETEVLNHLLNDKTLLEVSKFLKTSISGINFHIRNLKAKYDCNTLHGIVGKFLSESKFE